MADNGIETDFRHRDVALNHEDGENVIVFGSFDQSSGLYVLPAPCVMNSTAPISTIPDDDASIWNRRLDQMNMKDLSEVNKNADDVQKI